MEVARFEKRLFSYLIDLIISTACGLCLGSTLILFANLIPWYFKYILIIVFCYFFFLLFNTTIPSLIKGRSIGCLIFRIKVVKNDGTPINFRIILIRALYLGLVPFVIVNAIYMVAVHSERTAFDRLTDSVTVDSKNK